VTSAMPKLRREVEPLKMTSAISPPRRLLALCSPRIQRTASTMLLLPEPLGPTIAVMPSPKVKLVLSAKLLNPIRSSRLSMQPPRSAHVRIRIAELGDEAKRVEIRNPRASSFELRIWGFEFVSDFEFGISDLARPGNRPAVAQVIGVARELFEH